MPRRGEFQLISELFAPLATSASALGLRDDAAYVAPTPGHTLVLKTDTVVGGVHFRLVDPPDLVARKALRVSLSDLAAKGARPIGVLQAITLARDTDDAYLTAYARGLAEDLTAFGIALLGGDTTAHRDAGPLTITVTAIGEVPEGAAILRGGARPGDLIFVSGTLGDAALGLRALEGHLKADATDREYLAGRYLLPQPRLALGKALRGLATSSLDVSDGLIADLGHICESSDVSAAIAWETVPRSSAAERQLKVEPTLRDLVLGGGDDYEIAFTAPSEKRAAIMAAADASKTPVTVIGAIGLRTREASAPGTKDVTVRGGDGQAIAVATPGFTHR